MIKEAALFGGGDSDTKSFVETATKIIQTQVKIFWKFLLPDLNLCFTHRDL